MAKKTLLLVILGCAFCGCGEKEEAKASGERDRKREVKTHSQLSGKIAFQSNEDGDLDIWVMRPDGTEKKKMTENGKDDFYPRWSYDGKWIAFVSNRDGNKDIYRVEIETGKEERLTEHPAEDMDPDWAPDGKKLVFTSRRDGKDDLYLLELEGKKVTRLTEAPGRNALASWSPDGKKLAFTSNRLLGWSIYLLDLETRAVAKVVSGHGACRPDWSPDGKWLSLVSQKADGKGDIFIVRPDGSDLRRLTHTSHVYDYFPSWNFSGEHIVFSRTKDKGKGPWDLFVVEVGSGREIQLTDSPFSESFPDWTKNK